MSTETIAGIQDPGARQRPAARRRARARCGSLSVVLAVVLVLAVARGRVAVARKAHAADERARRPGRGRERGPQFALRVDTFDGKNIDKYSKSVQGLLTTKYKTEFDKQFERSSRLRPGPRRRAPARC